MTGDRPSLLCQPLSVVRFRLIERLAPVASPGRDMELDDQHTDHVLKRDVEVRMVRTSELRSRLPMKDELLFVAVIQQSILVHHRLCSPLAMHGSSRGLDQGEPLYGIEEHPARTTGRGAERN